MGKLVGAVALFCVVIALSVAVLVSAVIGGAAAPTDSPTPATSGSPADRTPALPAGWADLDRAAAATCSGLSWSVLAAIGTVESDSGQSTASGVASGANSAGAEGPMQFEPTTFAAYATSGPGGVRPPTPYDPVDAVYTAATYLCANGGGATTGLRGAVFAYNHDATYVDTVLTLSLAFGDDTTVDGTVVTALIFAARQLGTPYLWGGTGSGGFDCSGLAQAAFAHAGVTLPRVAQDQYTAGPQLADGATVLPGDLVFFGTGATSVDHVGIYVGSGLMIDAPHTGALTRVESAGWSGLVGATRPA
ncbi:MAG TPA: bifunctional lytic transglycosylase/C40 family peptidase [Acidimicrobiales bacterium]